MTSPSKSRSKSCSDSIPDAHPLGAVIHAAGALDDGLIDSMGPERIERVFAPKAEGAWNLHELTEDKELSAFVCFSSIAATLGGPGQSNYAAANAFCDALAQQRQAQGLPATSIAWGLWATESAMTAGLSEADLARMERSGIGALSDAEGLDLFDAALAAGTEQALACRLVPAGLRAQAKAGVLHPLLRGLVRRSGARASAHAAPSRQRLASALRSQSARRSVLELVRDEVAAVLGHGSAEAIEPAEALQGPRLRLPGRGRAAQPPLRLHRPAPARDGRLRLPDLGQARRPPARRGRPRAAPAGRRRGRVRARSRSRSSAWPAATRRARSQLLPSSGGGRSSRTATGACDEPRPRASIDGG